MVESTRYFKNSSHQPKPSRESSPKIVATQDARNRVLPLAVMEPSPLKHPREDLSEELKLVQDSRKKQTLVVKNLKVEADAQPDR